MYIPLPEQPDREILLRALLKKDVHSLSDEEITKLSSATHGYSGADLKALCSDAALGPLRDLGPRAMEVAAEDVPPITYTHFRRTLKGMNPSVREEDLEDYIKFDTVFGNKPGKDDDDDDSKSTKSDTTSDGFGDAKPSAASAAPAQQSTALALVPGADLAAQASAHLTDGSNSPGTIEQRVMGVLQTDALAAEARTHLLARIMSSPERQGSGGDDDGEDDRKLAPGEQPKT